MPPSQNEPFELREPLSPHLPEIQKSADPYRETDSMNPDEHGHLDPGLTISKNSKIRRDYRSSNIKTHKRKSVRSYWPPNHILSKFVDKKKLVKGQHRIEFLVESRVYGHLKITGKFVAQS